MSLSRRRQPRIRYRGALRIVDKSAGSAIDATCLDLSAGGIGVRATGAYAVGSDVVCELEVNGRALSLPGTVAWSEPPREPDDGLPEPEPRQRDSRRTTQGLYRLGTGAAASAEPMTEYVIDTGAEEQAQEPEPEERPDTKTLLRLGAADARDTPMGICFQALVADQTRALEDLLREGEPVTSPVQLYLRGVSTPVAVRAETHEHGITLRSTLPFLAVGSEVRFRVADGEEHQGRVQRVSLGALDAREGPRLEVVIAHHDVARGHEFESSRTSLEPQPASVPARAGAGSRRAPVAMSLLAGIALGAAAMWLADRQAHGGEAARNPLPATMRAPSAPVAPTPSLSPSPSTTSSPSTTTTQVAAVAAPAVVEPAPSPATEPTTPEPQAVATPAPSTAPAAEPPVPAAQAPAASTETATAPAVTVEGPYTRIFVPMQGTDAEIGRYDLTSPGVVVSLPHAHSLIPLADYPIYKGLVRRVWVRAYRDGVQVRVVWRPGPGHAKVVFDDKGLMVSVRPF